MKPKSAIEKGKRFEKFVAEQIELAGLGKATRTPGSGSGLKKSDIFANIPFSIEAKNQRKIKILDWIDQSKESAEKGNFAKEKWAVVFNDFRKREFQEIYVVIDFWQFLDLLKREKEPLIKEPDKNLKYKLEKFKYLANDIIKWLK